MVLGEVYKNVLGSCIVPRELTLLVSMFRIPKAALLVCCLILAIFLMPGCADTASSGSVQNSSENSSVLADPNVQAKLQLTEKSAASILRNYLVDCISKMESGVQGSKSAKQQEDVSRSKETKWWREFPVLVTSARPLGNTELPHSKSTLWDYRVTNSRAAPPPNIRETWVVIGPGLESSDEGFVLVSGTWKVYAGTWDANAIDGPAMLASRELERMLPEEAHC